MKDSATAWRLIDAGSADGPANMALDEALLSCFTPGSSAPVLRLYGWSPAALSIGRYQDAGSALNLDTCRADGVPVVRRMTGGGIIFHADELTYSIICSPDDLGESVGVKRGFRRLCGFLLGAYRKLGLNPSFAIDDEPGNRRLGERTHFCFAGKEEYDVLVGGRKIGGNAQRRLRGAILQHGSIPLKSRVQDALRYLKEPAPEAEGAVSLAELDVLPELDELKRLVVTSFQEEMGVAFVLDSFTPREKETMAQLEATKYRCNGWNLGLG